MILYNNKMLLLLRQCQRLKLYYLQHSLKALLTQIGLYLKPHINFYVSFFHEWSFLSLELKPMNPLTRKPHLFETALPNVCLQCFMGIA